MNEHISKIINHPYRNHVIVGVASFIGGGVAGYILGRRRPDVVFELNEDLDLTFDVKDAFVEKDTTPEPLIIDRDVYLDKGSTFVEDHLKEDSPEGWFDEQEESEVKDLGEVVAHNVFAESDSDWNYEEEIERRALLDPRLPYVLHKDEFFADEKDYTQSTLTYYEGDGILSDEEGKPIYNFDSIIGPLRFGHGSGDPNVFYVRNDRTQGEFEILRDPGLFSVEVLGLEIEDNARVKDLKHSAVPKFRGD